MRFLFDDNDRRGLSPSDGLCHKKPEFRHHLNHCLRERFVRDGVRHLTIFAPTWRERCSLVLPALALSDLACLAERQD